MPRRRAPRGFNQRTVSAIESMIPGTLGGRMSNASPVVQTDVQAAIQGGVATGVAQGSDEWFRDLWDIADAAETDYPLTFVPKARSLFLFLRGLCLNEGTDYSVDYATPQIVLTAAAERDVDDILWARYETESTTPAISTILSWGIRSNAATIIGSFDAVALIDPGTAFSDVSAHIVPGDQGCLVFGATDITPGADGDYLFLRVNNTSPGLWHFTRVGGVDTDTLIQAIAAANVTGDYEVTCSGDDVTVSKNGSSLGTWTLTGDDAAALSRSKVGLRGSASTPPEFTDFSAASGAVTDAFPGPDSDQLGTADTGQVWVGTS